jgi:Na+/alanine symporter
MRTACYLFNWFKASLRGIKLTQSNSGDYEAPGNISYFIYISAVLISFSSAYRPIVVSQKLMVFLVKDIILTLIQINLRILLSSCEAHCQKLSDNLSTSCVSFSSCCYIFVISLLILAVDLRIHLILCSIFSVLGIRFFHQ